MAHDPVRAPLEVIPPLVVIPLVVIPPLEVIPPLVVIPSLEVIHIVIHSGHICKYQSLSRTLVTWYKIQPHNIKYVEPVLFLSVA